MNPLRRKLAELQAERERLASGYLAWGRSESEVNDILRKVDASILRSKIEVTNLEWWLASRVVAAVLVAALVYYLFS